MFEVQSLPLSAAALITLPAFFDARGSFVKTFHDTSLKESGIDFELKESYFSYSKKDVFRALRLTSPDDVKVVILGQDPYHGDDRGTPQAHGLAFSVPPAVRTPPSLRNIFKEIAANFGHDTPRHGCLDTWARQGVLLLNTVLTVERGAAASHAKRGWEQCTDTLIRELANRHRGLVFMLWGAHAQAKRALFDASAHCVLEAPHPSPLSAHRGFLGCRHFALAKAPRPCRDAALFVFRSSRGRATPVSNLTQRRSPPVRRPAPRFVLPAPC